MDKDLYKAKRAREELSATGRGNRAVTGSAGWLRGERHWAPCLDGLSEKRLLEAFLQTPYGHMASVHTHKE